MSGSNSDEILTAPLSSFDGTGGHVLVVDDEERNRRLLRDVLISKGCRVTEARDGEEALVLARRELPDVILLDIMMPKFDGFEVCRSLKADTATMQIPILIVTALKERADSIKGLAAGADDFITKPIDTEEVSLRVRNALRMKRMHDQVSEDYEKLSVLEKLRDNLIHMVVHDMRTPLTAVLGSLDVVHGEMADAGIDLEMVQIGKAATDELMEMVNELLDVSRLEAGELPLHIETCEGSDVVEEATRLLDPTWAEVSIALDVPPETVPLQCDRNLIRRVITNLAGNAIKFTPRGGQVTVMLRSTDTDVNISVTDTGRGIAPEHHDRVFEKFGQIEARQDGVKHSSGLGLTFCKLAVESHGGKIGLESEVGKGCTFWFTLPATPVG